MTIYDIFLQNFTKYLKIKGNVYERTKNMGKNNSSSI